MTTRELDKITAYVIDVFRKKHHGSKKLNVIAPQRIQVEIKNCGLISNASHIITNNTQNTHTIKTTAFHEIFKQLGM
jgi:hypothetical protein